MKKFLILIIILSAFLLISCGSREASVKDTQDMDPAKLLEQANQLYEQGSLKDALSTFETIYNMYPTSREYIDAALGLSRCYNDLGNYEKGMNILYNLVSENLVPSRVPEIYNEMAKYYEVNAGISSVAGLADEDKDFKNAIEFYRKAIHYPNSDDKQAKSYAQYRIGELYVALHQFKDATLAYRATINSFPDTKWATRADSRLEEMRLAVSNVLQDIKQEGTMPPKEESAEPQPVEEEMPVEEPPSQQSPAEVPDTTTVQETPPPDTTDTQEIPVDTLQTAPADTSKKPALDLE